MIELSTNHLGTSIVSHYTGIFDDTYIPLLVYYNERKPYIVMYNKSGGTRRLQTSPTRDGPWMDLAVVRNNRLGLISVVLPYIRIKENTGKICDFWIVQYIRGQ